MSIFNKRNLVLAAMLGGIVYTSQYYTLSGWHHLRLEPIATSTSDTNQLPLANSSLGDHLRSDVPFQSTSFPSTSSLSAQSTSSFQSSSSAQSVVARQSTQSSWLTSFGSKPSASKTTFPTIRIASFNLESFGETKLGKVAIVEIVARILRQFDVIAIQHINSRQQDILPRLIEKINQSDRHYEYCIGPRVGDDANAQQFAFVFDADTIETDRQQLYTVDDPQRLLGYAPLVGWFRTTAVPANEAFTFSVVNVRIESSRVDAELRLLPDLIRSIRNDGRAEDDILIAGDFGCSDQTMSGLRNMGMIFAIEGLATTVSGDMMLDNIVMPAKATDEFNGRSGVIDFLRQFNLSLDQASQVSSHLPVWAEFIAIEGGTPGFVGTRQ